MAIPSQKENPNGLHTRYSVTPLNGKHDPDAEYFVLRLDEGTPDKNHLKACRAAIQIYAGLISDTIPELAADLMERYSPKSK